MFINFEFNIFSHKIEIDSETSFKFFILPNDKYQLNL